MRPNDWGAPTGAYRGRPAALLGTLIAVPAVLLGVVAWLGTGNVVVGVLATTAIVAGFALWARGADRRLLSALGAQPLDPNRDPRAVNLVAGMAAELECTVPQLWVIEGDGPNAIAFRVRARTAIGITRSLLDDYTRTELEAVIAHCFVKLATDRSNVFRSLVNLGDTAPRLDPSDDVRAAAITRFPPALASAVGKARPRSDHLSYLWFVPVAPATSVDERIAAISDL